jgi:hypothetical protein
MTRQLPPKEPADQEEEASTALDVKAISQVEAERVLRSTGFTQEEIPTVHAAPSPAAATPKGPGVVGALPRPAPRPGATSRTLPPSADMFHGLPRPTSARPPMPMDPEKPTRPGVPSQAPLTPKGRATLLLDNSVPPATEMPEGEPSQERPPIVVPGAGTTPPKAVTQAPPWGEGAAHVGPPIPKGPPPPRPPEPSIEEISGSLLLADASGELSPAAVEELSGSLLVEDAPDGKGPPLVSRPPTKPPVPSTPPPPQASVKPPVPRSPSGRPLEPAHRALLGMPELPKSTPPPQIDLLAPPPPPSAPPIETVVVTEPPAPQPEPAPPPPTAPITGDIELTRLPRSGLQPLLDGLGEAVRKLREQLAAEGAQGRPRWFFPAVIVGGLSVGIGLFAILGSVIRHGSDSAHGHDTHATGEASTARSATPLATTASAAPISAAPSPPPAIPSLPACTVSGTPHVIGPSATVTAGVEVVRLGDDLALGFAPSDHDAIGIRLDAGSLSAKSTVKAHTRDIIRRVTPLLGKNGALAVGVDADRKKDALQGRRTVLADPAVQFGASDAHVAWARPGGGPSGELWPLEDGGNIEALRGAAENMGERTIALSFRRGAGVWMGVVTGTSTLAPRGALAHVDGMGNAVGSPAIALSGGSVMVAWSDRASADDPWRLRWTRFDAGSPPLMAETFVPPAGGKGEQAMSPSLAALPGGRFLLVWTEGPASGHDVRALTLAQDGKPVGDPLVISNPGVNAGQGQAAVTPLGQGVVAFLETGGNGFQVAATPITCGQ